MQKWTFNVILIDYNTYINKGKIFQASNMKST